MLLQSLKNYSMILVFILAVLVVIPVVYQYAFAATVALFRKKRRDHDQLHIKSESRETGDNTNGRRKATIANNDEPVDDELTIAGKNEVESEASLRRARNRRILQRLLSMPSKALLSLSATWANIIMRRPHRVILVVALTMLLLSTGIPKVKLENNLEKVSV